MRLDPSVTAPVPRLRPWLPLNVNAPFQFCTLLGSVMPATVLLTVPPLIVNIPEPTALLLFSTSKPAKRFVPDEYPLLLPIVRLPAPFLTNKLEPPMPLRPVIA